MIYKSGEQTNKKMKLYVKDEYGNTIGEIQVPSGNRIPPTRLEGVDYYSKEK